MKEALDKIIEELQREVESRRREMDRCRKLKEIEEFNENSHYKNAYSHAIGIISKHIKHPEPNKNDKV